MRRSSLLGILVVLVCVAAERSPLLAQGMRFQADWLFMTRDNDGPGSFFSGPDSFSADDLSYGYESGYRLMLGGGTDVFEVEARFSRIDDWGEGTGSVLSGALVFDDGAGSGFLPGPIPATVLSFNNALFAAATDDFVDLGAIDETLETEFLLPGSTVSFAQDSQYEDLEINITTSRSNWYRFGFGYRRIDFDENSALNVVGLFDAIDVDDGAVSGDPTNDPNDGLSNIALNEAGLALVAGGASPWDAIATGAGPDIITMTFAGNATNELNGVQGTFDAVVVDSETWLIDFFGRLGLFHNDARGRVLEQYTASENEDNTFARELWDSEDDFAWAFSSGLRIALKLTDNCRIHTGYEFVFIDGLALGAEQIFQVGSGGTFTLDTEGSVLIHGGRLGVEFIW